MRRYNVDYANQYILFKLSTLIVRTLMQTGNNVQSFTGDDIASTLKKFTIYTVKITHATVLMEIENNAVNCKENAAVKETIETLTPISRNPLGIISNIFSSCIYL